MKKIYTSIDIGSDTVKFLVGEVVGKEVNVLASTAIKSKGIKNGLIIDSNLAVNTIKDGIKVLNEELGFDIKKAIVNVPDYNVKFMYVTGKINVDGIISTENISNVIKDSAYNKLDKDYELVTVLPLDFIIDSKESTNYPIGKDWKLKEL